MLGARWLIQNETSAFFKTIRRPDFRWKDFGFCSMNKGSLFPETSIGPSRKCTGWMVALLLFFGDAHWLKVRPPALVRRIAAVVKLVACFPEGATWLPEEMRGLPPPPPALLFRRIRRLPRFLLDRRSPCTWPSWSKGVSLAKFFRPVSRPAYKVPPTGCLVSAYFAFDRAFCLGIPAGRDAVFDALVDCKQTKCVPTAADNEIWEGPQAAMAERRSQSA